MRQVLRKAWGAAIILWTVSSSVAGEAPRRQLSVEQALQEAFTRSPILVARSAAAREAEGRLITARTYPYDPAVSAGAADREGDGESSTDWNVELAQIIELGNKRGQRAAGASADVAAAGANLRREERLLAARVSALFVEALRARDLLGVEQTNAELARSLAAVAGKRFEAGSVPQIEVNLAQVQVGRAQRGVGLARAAYQVACAALAEVIGLDPLKAPEPVGALDLPPRSLVPVAELTDGALRHRADLEALRSTIESARARVELARRENVPDLAVAAFYGEEEGTDRLLGGRVGIRIPLFNRNRGPIAEARAAEARAVAESKAAELRIRREVAEARSRYDAALDASSTLQDHVLGTLQDNLELLELSFEAGKTGWTEVLVFRREFIDAQRAYIESLADARLAGIELDLAAGRLPASARP